MSVIPRKGSNEIEFNFRPLVSSLFDGDSIPDIAVVENKDNLSSSFTILSGANGSSLWTISINNELSVPPIGVAPSLSTRGGFLLWLPKSDLRIMPESAVNARPSSADKKNRKRRESSQMKESELEQDLEMNRLENAHGNEAELYSQIASDARSQFAKNSEQAYKSDLERALLYGVLDEERKQESENFNDIAQLQRREPYSRETYSDYQARNGLAKELEELHESDGRQKRVAPQQLLRRQSFKAHRVLSQPRDESFQRVRGRMHGSLPIHQSKKSDIHDETLSDAVDNGKKKSLVAVQTNSRKKQNKSPIVTRQDVQRKTHAESPRSLNDGHLRSRDHISQDPLEKSTQKPAVSQETLSSHSVLADSCPGNESSNGDTLVAVFVHKAQNAPTELDKVLEESSLYLGK